MGTKKILLLVALLIGAFSPAKSQDVALKTNTLYWLAGGTINGGIEFAVSPKVTVDLSGSYNPWTYNDDKKMRFWLAEPEVKYWFCEKFQGHFLGVYAHGAQFFGGFKDTRYDGYMAGLGLSYGYDWILSPHWNIEAEIGLGVERAWYKESDRIPCYNGHDKTHRNYLGPSKAAITFTYIF